VLCQLNNDCIFWVSFEKVAVSVRYRVKSHRQSFMSKIQQTKPTDDTRYVTEPQTAKR
jgi:hypothetical protein